jgi:hypothetical protein
MDINPKEKIPGTMGLTATPLDYLKLKKNI